MNRHRWWLIKYNNILVFEHSLDLFIVDRRFFVVFFPVSDYIILSQDIVRADLFAIYLHITFTELLYIVLFRVFVVFVFKDL